MSSRYETHGAAVLDTRTGLEWQKNHSGPMTWQEAMDHAAKLGDDWRMPTIEELLTLVDFSRYNPASSFPGMPVDYFWSSSSSAGSASYAWYVYFYSGYVNGYVKTFTNYVRCVRRVIDAKTARELHGAFSGGAQPPRSER